MCTKLVVNLLQTSVSEALHYRASSVAAVGAPLSAYVGYSSGRRITSTLRLLSFPSQVALS